MRAPLLLNALRSDDAGEVIVACVSERRQIQPRHLASDDGS